MYETYFGIREKPFSLVPDPAFLYFSDKHQSALAMLEYGLLNRSGFTVITGGIGTGKTTLVRHLLNHMEQDITLGLISNTHQNFTELLQWILMAFGLPFSHKTQAEMHQAFVDFVIHEYARNRRTVLIVDESQNLSVQALEELRMLSNINADKDVVLQIVLVGQKELLETLKRPDLSQFAQRITANFHLEPLTQGETRAYIRHRLVVAGGSPKLFSDAACDEVFTHTGGVPRLINLLCDAALVYGFAEQRPQIDAALIRDVARDKRKGGLFPMQEEIAANDEADEDWVRVFGNGGKRGRGAGAEAPRWRAASEGAAVGEAEEGVLRVAIASDSQIRRGHLRELLEARGVEVSQSLSLDDPRLGELRAGSTHVLLVDLDEADDDHMPNVRDLRTRVGVPMLFNESRATEASLAGIDPAFGDRLRSKLAALAPSRPAAVSETSAADDTDQNGPAASPRRDIGGALAEKLSSRTREPAARSSSEAGENRPSGNPRIAIVSDNPGIAIELGEIFAAQGLEIDLGHSLDDEITAHLDPKEITALVLDYSGRNSAQGSRILASLTLWDIPILVNNRSAAEAYIAGDDAEFPQRLLKQLRGLVPKLKLKIESEAPAAPAEAVSGMVASPVRPAPATHDDGAWTQQRLSARRQPQEQLIKRILAAVGAVLWMGAIYYSSSQSQAPIGLAIPGGDWILHALGYGVLGLLLLWTFRPGPHGFSMLQALVATLLATLYGLSDEWHQSLVPGRDPDVMDLLFDAMGALLATGIAAWFSRVHDQGPARRRR